MRGLRALPVLAELLMAAPAFARRFTAINPDPRPGEGLTTVAIRLGDRLILRECDRLRAEQPQ